MFNYSSQKFLNTKLSNGKKICINASDVSAFYEDENGYIVVCMKTKLVYTLIKACTYDEFYSNMFEEN